MTGTANTCTEEAPSKLKQGVSDFILGFACGVLFGTAITMFVGAL